MKKFIKMKKKLINYKVLEIITQAVNRKIY